MKKLKINTTEIWKDIKGYEGRYQVSNMGRVKSLGRTTSAKNNSEQYRKERFLKPMTSRNGYLQVNLYDSYGKKRFAVHRLVCEVFHENPENKPCVNHIDENKTNNTASNLEWCTYQENINHGTHNARSAKARSKPVGQYTTDGKLIKVWQSIMEVERQLGFDYRNTSAVARGERKTAYGYVWKYVEK